MGLERKGPERLGDVGRTTFAQDADDEIPQGGHHSWTGAGSDLRAVFVEGHIADPVESVFDAPLASIECEDSLGGSLSGG